MTKSAAFALGFLISFAGYLILINFQEIEPQKTETKIIRHKEPPPLDSWCKDMCELNGLVVEDLNYSFDGFIHTCHCVQSNGTRL